MVRQAREPLLTSGNCLFCKLIRGRTPPRSPDGCSAIGLRIHLAIDTGIQYFYAAISRGPHPRCLGAQIALPQALADPEGEKGEIAIRGWVDRYPAIAQYQGVLRSSPVPPVVLL